MEEEIKVILTPSSVSYKHFVLSLQENAISVISHETQTFYQHNTLWCSVTLWAVLQDSWQVLSVFKYCKKKISYNCYKAELLLLFFNVEVTLYVCLVSVSTVFIKTYVFLFFK